MAITGRDAVEYLETIEDRVALLKKDNTNKFWSYKIKSGKKTEFAFDPKTKNGLYLRIDLEPPALLGVTDVEKISGKDVSTALDRVFSGGLHKANYVASIADVTALELLIDYYERL